MRTTTIETPEIRAQDAAAAEEKPEIPMDLYDAFARQGRSLIEVTWEQHRFHEHRRWSVVDMLAQIDGSNLDESDRLHVWNAGRAELTTKPGADRVARLFDQECRRFQGVDDALANVMQACGTWSRYWNEEEAHHETSFNRLSSMLGLERISDATFIEYRKIFPDDNALRTLTLLAISEITAAVNYAQASLLSRDPGLRALFKQVGADEIQHMTYFVSFARALVQSGKFHAKDALSVAHFFLREEGDLRGSRRPRVEARDTHVNWWDHVEFVEGVASPEALERKQTLVFSAVQKIAGVTVRSAAEVEEAWMDLVGC
jgi:hypothetical protein